MLVRQRSRFVWILRAGSLRGTQNVMLIWKLSERQATRSFGSTSNGNYFRSPDPFTNFGKRGCDASNLRYCIASCRCLSNTHTANRECRSVAGQLHVKLDWEVFKEIPETRIEFLVLSSELDLSCLQRKYYTATFLEYTFSTVKVIRTWVPGLACFRMPYSVRFQFFRKIQILYVLYNM